MQQNQLLAQIRPFGRISSSKLEMDPKIGQSLGIFSVTFAHDFDERDRAKESATASGQGPQHGAKAAKAAQIALHGRQMGPTRVQAFLDRDGEVLAEKVKEKIAANEAKLRPPPPPPTPPAPVARLNASPATPSASKPNMPPRRSHAVHGPPWRVLRSLREDQLLLLLRCVQAQIDMTAPPPNGLHHAMRRARPKHGRETSPAPLILTTAVAMRMITTQTQAEPLPAASTTGAFQHRPVELNLAENVMSNYLQRKS